MMKILPKKKLFNFRLFFFIAVSLAIGIAVAYAFTVGNDLVGIIVCASFFLCLIIYIFAFTEREKRLKSLSFSLVFAIFLALGCGTFYLQTANYVSADLDNHYYDVRGKISAIYETEYGGKYVLSDVRVAGNVKGTLRYKAEVYVYGETSYELGDVIAFSDYLYDKPEYYDGRFSSYAIADDVKYSVTLAAEDITFVESSPDVFQKINLAIKRNLAEGLSEQAFSVSYAMLTGDSDYIDADVLTSYRQAGVAHIFAVSGLHIGFIATVLNFLFDKLRLHRALKAVSITSILVFYSGVCGFSASSVRATIMAAVMLFSAIKGEKYDGITSVSVAAVLILPFNPAQLFCVGFQLSFAVVFGILVLAKPLAKAFKFLPRKIADSLGTVLAAQLFGGAICISSFGSASFISVVANLIFIPVASVIFTATLIAVLLSEIIGLHAVLFFLPDLALNAVNFFVTLLDYDAFMIGGFVFGGYIVFYYLSLITVSGLVNLKRLSKIFFSVVFALIFVCGTATYNVDLANRTYVMVGGSESITFTIVKSPDACVMIVSDASGVFSKSEVKRAASNGGVNKIDYLIITGGFDADIPLLVSGLRTVFALDKVCYYGERDELTETVFLKSFPDYYIDNFTDGEEIFATEKLNMRFELDGTFVDAEVAGKNVGVFSSFENRTGNYVELEKEYYIAVLLDDADLINSRLKPEKAVYYRAKSGEINSERNGIITYLIG